MTNEELAVRIQNGEAELIPTLWSQVERFIRDRAWRKAKGLDGFGGVEVEDLYQSGFFALLDAVKAFEPQTGYTFITYLVRPLKTAFAEVAGYHTKTQKNDPIQNSLNLDAPIYDDGDDTTMGDVLPDPSATKAYEYIEEDQLRAAMSRVVNDLPAAQRNAIIARHYFGLALNQNGRKNEALAIQALRRPRIREELVLYR